MNVYLCTKNQNPPSMFLLYESLFAKNQSVVDQGILKPDWPTIMSEKQKTQNESLKLLNVFLEGVSNSFHK